MSRPLYDVKESYTGSGSLSSYTFDFKITNLLQLLVVVADASGLEIERVRGDDVTFLSGVVFNPSEGGGAVNLLANLPSGYKMILLLADDAPIQDYEFRNKTSFTLRRFEDALDVILGAVQRLTYKTKQAFRINDLDDESIFNAQLPAGIALSANKVIQVNATGDGLAFGPTSSDVAAVPALVAAAVLAASNAATSESNAAASALASSNSAAASALSAVDSANSALAAAVSAASILLLVEEKNANFNAAFDRIYLVTGLVSAQLPAPLINKVIRIKIVGSGPVTLVRNAGEKIDNVVADLILNSSNQSVTLVSNGVDWFII